MTSLASSSVVPSSRFTSSISDLLDGLHPSFNYICASVACVAAFIMYITRRPNGNLDAIPAIGRTGFFTSYLDAVRFLKHGDEFIREGYIKYQPGIFRVPYLNRWQVVVSGSQLTDELRKAPDDVLSASEATRVVLASDWTLGRHLRTNPYHIPIIRSQLTRNLGNLFSGLRQEIVLAFDEELPPTEEWTKVTAYRTIMKIISRVSNYAFVGAPLCRDPEFIALNVQFTINVVLGAKVIWLSPDFLKPIARHMLTNIPLSIRTGVKHLAPIIEERKQKIEGYGMDYPDKPFDMLSWLLDKAKGDELSTENLTRHVLHLNFVAMHTSSTTFTNALYDLASHPEYIEPIRKEIETVIAKEGWSKAAMTRMRKLDSFMKESQRMSGLGSLSMLRKALKDFTFSDGTYIPKGSFIAVAVSRHFDDDVYPDAGTFKGFRFSDMREEGDETANQMVATSLDYLTFGHGKHSCPGRFFAVSELKAMIAHVLLVYDIMMTNTPQEAWYSVARTPDTKAEVMFRKRRS